MIILLVQWIIMALLISHIFTQCGYKGTSRENSRESAGISNRHRHHKKNKTSREDGRRGRKCSAKKLRRNSKEKVSQLKNSKLSQKTSETTESTEDQDDHHNRRRKESQKSRKSREKLKRHSHESHLKDDRKLSRKKVNSKEKLNKTTNEQEGAGRGKPSDKLPPIVKDSGNYENLANCSKEPIPGRQTLQFPGPAVQPPKKEPEKPQKEATYEDLWTVNTLNGNAPP